MPSWKSFKHGRGIDQSTAEDLVKALHRKGIHCGDSFKEWMDSANSLRNTCPKWVSKVTVSNEVNFLRFCLEWIETLQTKGWDLGESLEDVRPVVNAIKSTVFEYVA